MNKHKLSVYMLIIITIVAAAGVICFSFGTYMNYHAIIQEGESESRTIILDAENTDEYMNSLITKGNLIEMLTALPVDIQNSINSVWCQIIGEDDIYYPHNLYSFYFRPENGKIVDGFEENLFKDDDYAEGKRYVKIGTGLYENTYMPFSLSVEGYPGEEPWTNVNKVSENQRSIKINGFDYEIIGSTDESYDPVSAFVYFPFTSLAENTPIRAQADGTDAVEIDFNDIITAKQYKAINDTVNMHMNGIAVVEPIELTETTETYYYKTIILITILITILSAINIAFLYRYIIEQDKKKINIKRLCGCTRLKAIAIYLLRYSLISFPLFILTELCYDRFLLPNLADFFPYITGAYSIVIYSVIFGIFVLLSIVILLCVFLYDIPIKISKLGEAIK